MARPRKDSPPDTFTSTELAVAGGTTPRNFALLVSKGLVPNSEIGGGYASSRAWRVSALGAIAMTGALYRGGMELLPAARLAGLVVGEFEEDRGILPTRLTDYLHKPLNPRSPYYPWGDDEVSAEQVRFLINDDFWLHHMLRTRTDIYRPRTTLVHDLHIEIVDRQYVFSRYGRAGDDNVRLASGTGKYTAYPEYRIIGWERGSDAEVRNISGEVRSLDFHRDRGTSAQMQRIEKEFIAARENAISTLSINVSLAIRNALDAIHEHRGEPVFENLISSKPEISGRTIAPHPSWDLPKSGEEDPPDTS
ncbi:hypothetical protein [Roseomonas sp. KE0001]|uniref:hypothetical protein n=1 Tax=Roseomonas sp. KE0001 TaxID=2479201 RepID=UPI0018DF4F5C|nr:hypothetical protein [Roseomonas sp. KE0001]MBI0435426.1 hypothetical protein [Roseomonas sp. KE0001]